MKKRILLLFVAMIGMATSVGWAQNDGGQTPTTPATKLTIQKIGDKDCIFANGNAVTVTAAQTVNTANADQTGQITITVDGTEESQTVANTYSLYGGSYGENVASSTIKMTSGTIYRIYGGGYGVNADQTGNITGTASIMVEGGKVSNAISGGGNQYAKTGKVSVQIIGKDTKIQCLYAGGFGYPAAKKLVRTWEEAVCGAKEVEINITDATLEEGLGCGGGQGYAYTGTSTVTITNAILGSFYGTLANGYADDITATLKGCTFKKLVGYFEFATINRGAVNNASFTFDNCTFNDLNDINAGVGPILGWDNSDTSGDPKPAIEGNISWKFINMNEKEAPVMHLGPGLSQANVEVIGAKTKLIKFTQTKLDPVTAFSIERNKTWTLGKGLSIEDDVTLTNNGTLNVVAPDVESLKAAIKVSANKISLVSGTTYELTEPLIIDKSVALTTDGEAKATIKGNLVVEAENVAINNLAFECNSNGTNYWMKNAITLFGNSITVNGCTFEGSAADNQYVANGIVIFPTAADNASYAITGNTFTNFNQEVGSGSNYWTSTALLLCDNTSITKKGASEATSIPALTSWNETSLADASNTFTNCFADYIHQTGTSYVYNVTSTAKAVADGINSIEKDQPQGTIVATSVSNADILAAVNTLKPSLEGKFIVKSKEGSIVADPNLVSTGTVYVLSKSGEEYAIKQQTVAPEVNFSSLKASVIEAGQPLSASILSGGSANVSGVFSWKEPATIVEKGAKKTYDVIFTPTDLIGYNVVDSTYTFDEIKQYYTVQTGKCANGHLEIASANTSNKYEEGSTLTVKPVADAHFAFDKYVNEEVTNNIYTVSANATLTAEFKPIMRTVTISVTGDGTVNVNGESKNNSFEVQEGSILTIQAAPNAGQVLSSLTADDVALKGNTVTVDNNMTIAATFATKPADKYVVKVSAVPNGKINLYDKDGNAIASGSSFKAGETISVVAVPDMGYKLEDKSLKYNSAVIADNKITVAEADVAITATFTKQSFAVSSSVTNGKIELKKNGETVSSGTTIEYGTELTATAEPTDASNYKLLSLVVNGKEIPNGGSFTVTAKTTVTAVMAKLATITIDETPQSFTYDGSEKEFVVKTTPAGITGFTVSYSDDGGKPVNAGTHANKEYTVTITRNADDTYAAVNATAQLIIKPAQMKGVAIPTLNDKEDGVATATDKGTYALDGKVDETTHLGTATFTPTDVNYAIMRFTVAGKSAVPCNYSKPATPQLQSAKLTTRAEVSSLNITVNGGGSVKVLNGGVEASTLYVGQTVTIQAIPSSTEYAANATWNDGSVSNTKEVTLASGTNDVTVAFQKKTEPTPTLTIPTDMVYNGTPFAGQTISVDGNSPVKDWDLNFEGIPTDAGTYKIYASRKADENYKAVVNKEVGSFTIGQAVADASNPVATEILQGQALAQSVITGTANVDGAFEWVNPNTILNADATGEAVRFVPTSKNYSVKDGLTADVKVTKTGVTIRTLNLTVVGEEFGAVSMTLDGNPATAGATVTKDQKLEVKATANTGYEASVQIDGSARTTYTIGETGNVEVKVTFTKKSEPSTPTDPEEPEVTDVTGVSLDATAKTLAVGESFALKATVKPADADNKKVSWSSSDATIASVDKDGNVKALKAGTCKITVTTEDGGYTATCDITVTIATGIDEILAANRIYTDYGQIIVEPTTSLEVLITDMTGRIVYHDRIAEKITVPVSGGIYIVRLVESKRVATTKVIVK
ncbi:Ig-like domain-containing protein [Parabacteroides gordonii]|uniref:Ig-like domain-containing protein n=1 Tax=Parabacteroides gordonii TaxID=574930 RepID=UPI0026EFC941|nr:Ig-like domain-containing protein [Parabacteroides gordonii]